MGLATFKGGIHPYEGKELSENQFYLGYEYFCFFRERGPILCLPEFDIERGCSVLERGTLSITYSYGGFIYHRRVQWGP